jgi:hypothetical protein
MRLTQNQVQDLLNAGRWLEVVQTGPHFRLLPSYGNRTALQRYDGHYGGNNIWRTLFGGPIDSPELAADMLAVAEERITRDEQAKRARSRDRAKKKAEKAKAA